MGKSLVMSVILLATVTVRAQKNATAENVAPSVILTTLVNFGNGNGQLPISPLAQGTDGNFYGMTYRAPDTSYGGIAYRLTPAGALTTLSYSCTQNDCVGSKPYDGLTLGPDGNFYGTTSFGGTGLYRTTNRAGTIIQVTASGLNTLYNFCSQLACQDGDGPIAPLALGSDGNFYGTTAGGGAHNKGTVFVVTPKGVETVLHSFDSTDGDAPYGGLVQATDGNFYGTALQGGTGISCQVTGGCGTVFKITAQGVLTTLYNFCQQSNCTDGFFPETSLIQAVDGNLYGTTVYGGNSTVNSGYGIAFKITTQGTFTILYKFCSVANCADGAMPSGFIQATDGNLYAAAAGGTGAVCYSSSYACGIIFKMTTTGTPTTVYSFCPQGGPTCPNGDGSGELVQGTDGNFYGVTAGGTHGEGTAFNLSTGLGPFVRTVTASGEAGSSVIILGTNLTAATSVTFNGVPAAFTVVSSSEIAATVPAGATTGAVIVTTPSGTLKSNKKFRISP